MTLSGRPPTSSTSRPTTFGRTHTSILPGLFLLALFQTSCHWKPNCKLWRGSKSHKYTGRTPICRLCQSCLVKSLLCIVYACSVIYFGLKSRRTSITIAGHWFLRNSRIVERHDFLQARVRTVMDAIDVCGVGSVCISLCVNPIVTIAEVVKVPCQGYRI